MENLLLVLARPLVSNPDKVYVEREDDAPDGLIVYRLVVEDSDMGRVIGKNGRIAKSIRQIVRSAAAMRGMRVAVEIG